MESNFGQHNKASKSVAARSCDEIFRKILGPKNTQQLINLEGAIKVARGEKVSEEKALGAATGNHPNVRKSQVYGMHWDKLEVYI